MILDGEREWIRETWFDPTGRFRSEIPAADRSALFKTAERILHLTDKAIAHIYPPATIGTYPTFGDLERIISLLSEITPRYGRLIMGVDTDPSIVEVEPGWTNVFEKPLFDSAWMATPEGFD